MQINTGKKVKAQRVVIYGPEGIGKTTIASQFPKPLFIDTEAGSYHMDVARTERPSSYLQVMSFVEELLKDRQGFETLVIDTADWLEKLIIQGVCAKHNVSGIEDIGYGKGYTYLKEDFGRLLDRLYDLCDKGMHIVLTAHSHMRKFEQPDEAGAYDRYELKLSPKQCAPLLKEWPDMLLFANYKTFVVEDDKTKSKKAKGGQRTLYTSHRPSHDAKNRHDLADEVKFEYASIAHCIPSMSNNDQKETAVAPVHEMQEEVVPSNNDQTNMAHLKPLYDLMQQHQVSEEHIRKAVSAIKAYPFETAIEAYAPDFVSGRLVANFDKVLNVIQQIKEQENK